MQTKTILIAAGGTGGHIYPAIAIAKAVQEIEPKTRIEFVGTNYGLESKIIPQAGFHLNTLSIGRLNKNVSILERIKTLVSLPFAICKSFLLILKYKPSVVFGVGGAVTGPVLLAAYVLHRKTILWEPNAYPGMANRYLAPFVDCALVVFEQSKKRLKSSKIISVGMPVRQEIEEVSPKENQGYFNILVFGGSQGARAINQTVATTLKQNKKLLDQVNVVHQTGKLDYSATLELYGELQSHPNLEIQPYLNDMEKRYQWADIVVCRCGTGTLSELAASGRPGLLVPLPTAADDHQRHNAEELVRAGASLMILQEDFSPEVFLATIEKLQNDRSQLQLMAKGIKKLHHPDAAKAVAKILLSEGK